MTRRVVINAIEHYTEAISGYQSLSPKVEKKTDALSALRTDCAGGNGHSRFRKLGLIFGVKAVVSLNDLLISKCLFALLSL